MEEFQLQRNEGDGHPSLRHAPALFQVDLGRGDLSASQCGMSSARNHGGRAGASGQAGDQGQNTRGQNLLKPQK